MSQRSCPDPSRWRELLECTLPAGEAALLGEHLENCADCRKRLDALTDGAGPWCGVSQPGGHRPGPVLQRVIDRLKEEGERTIIRDPDLEFLDPPIRPGQIGRLATYEVQEIIGRGGMGVVLKALDPSLNRFVAIKVLAPQWASSGAARQRFAREAKATAAVRHDHVIAIHHIDEVRGLPYLVMEYIHGTSLQERLNRTGPMELAEVLRIGMQVAAGLEAAHAQGLIHRDVKPSNILLENGVERVKLSDFGLARAVDDASLTQSGVIAGTPLYMAPEQALGLPLDHRADLFSLGSVLYTLCTGRPPFRAPSTVAVLKRVCEDEPRPIREINPMIPEWLEQIVARLHAKHPIDRYQSAGEVRVLLEQSLAHSQHPGRPVLPRAPAPAPDPAPVAARSGGGLALKLILAGVLVLFLAPCLLMGLMLGLTSYLMSDLMSKMPPIPPFAEQSEKQADRDPGWVLLGNGSVEQGKSGLLRFRVDYEFRPGAADATRSYVWVVRAGERILLEKPLQPKDLAAEGTLHGERRLPLIAAKEPLETYLESKRLVPGKSGWQRERISNVVKLAP
jgi:serine/threonine-protein kinase